WFVSPVGHRSPLRVLLNRHTETPPNSGSRGTTLPAPEWPLVPHPVSQYEPDASSTGLSASRVLHERCPSLRRSAAGSEQPYSPTRSACPDRHRLRAVRAGQIARPVGKSCRCSSGATLAE